LRLILRQRATDTTTGASAMSAIIITYSIPIIMRLLFLLSAELNPIRDNNYF
jgi:hypothetical protein